MATLVITAVSISNCADNSGLSFLFFCSCPVASCYPLSRQCYVLPPSYTYFCFALLVSNCETFGITQAWFCIFATGDRDDGRYAHDRGRDQDP